LESAIVGIVQVLSNVHTQMIFNTALHQCIQVCLQVATASIECRNHHCNSKCKCYVHKLLNSPVQCRGLYVRRSHFIQTLVFSAYSVSELHTVIITILLITQDCLVFNNFVV